MARAGSVGGNRAVRIGRSPVILAVALLALLLTGCSPSGQVDAGGSTGGSTAARSSASSPLTPSSGTPSPVTPSGLPSTGAAPTSPITLSVVTTAPTAKTSTVPTTTRPATGSARPPIPTPATVTRTKPGRIITVGPPRPTAEPAAVAADCPYLSADVVSIITGQHHGQTKLVRLQPHPMCVFYRSDGGLMGSVRVVQADNPAAAVAAVNQHVPIAGSQPASQPLGWTGGSMTSAGQMTQDSSAGSVYAVSKGNIAVVAEEDESPSIKARVMAICAIYGLALEKGQAPDYCSATQ